MFVSLRLRSLAARVGVAFLLSRLLTEMPGTKDFTHARKEHEGQLNNTYMSAELRRGFFPALLLLALCLVCISPVIRSLAFLFDGTSARPRSGLAGLYSCRS